MLEAAWEGLALVLSWPNIVYPVAGTLLAMLFAVIPGLGGVTLLALAIPLTFSWDLVPVLLLFGALVGGATFAGSITAILLNMPGKAPNAATTLDGYPMAQQGQAKTAIGCSAAASALGSTFGIVVLIALIPVLRAAVLAFGPPEFLTLTLWGLTTIVAVSQGTMLKGLIAAGIGFLLSFVGVDPRTAEARYTFGSLYLWDGLGTVPVFLGLFAVAEALHLSASSRRSISGVLQAQRLAGSTWAGVTAVFRHWGLFLRSSLIGTVVGAVPGIGGTVASFIAYGQATQTRRNPEGFGRGDVRGVLAPEAANDAKDGSSLLPTLAFGIPGSEGTLLLLLALTLHGLTPGQALFTQHLSLVFALIWSLFISNWLTSLLGLALVRPLVRLTLVRVQALVPCIFVLAATGAYLYAGRLEDVTTAFAFGAFGALMKRHGWPRVPLVIAFVLGGLFEQNVHLTLRLQELGRIDFWRRPIAMTLLALAAFSLAVPVWQGWRARRRGAA